MSLRVIEGLAELKLLIGQDVGVSEWFEVSQDLIDRFANVTLDEQSIHIDRKRARAESPLGTTIAHGFLTLSLLSHLRREAVQIRGDFSRSINYGFNRIRFPSPVPAGSRIRSHCTLQSFEEVEGGAQLTWHITVEIENQSKPALVAQWLGRLYH